MKIKKRAGIILCITGMVIIIALSLYKMENNQQPETIKTQEEYQMELLDTLDRMDLLAWQGDIRTASGRHIIAFSQYLKDMNLPRDIHFEIRPRTEIAPGVEIFHELFAMYSHCCRLASRTESLATVEDIAKLYDSYDEELEKKFLALYDWWAGQNGAAFCDYYDETIRVAYDLYLRQYGFFNGREVYGEMLTEDKTALEQFIRDNPDFMPKEVYYEELRNMRIINWDELDALRKAAREAQKSV